MNDPVPVGERHRAEAPPARGRWLWYAVGVVVLAYGAYGLLTSGISLVAWARFALFSVVLHDGVLAPAVVLAGVALTRVIPGRSRAYVQAGLMISGAVTLLAAPFLLGYGRNAGVPSALPLDYGRGLLVVLAATWAGVALVALARSALRPRRRVSRPDGRRSAGG